VDILEVYYENFKWSDFYQLIDKKEFIQNEKVI